MSQSTILINGPPPTDAMPRVAYVDGWKVNLIVISEQLPEQILFVEALIYCSLCRRILFQPIPCRRQRCDAATSVPMTATITAMQPNPLALETLLVGGAEEREQGFTLQYRRLAIFTDGRI